MKYKVKLLSTCFVEGYIEASHLQGAFNTLDDKKLIQSEIIKGNLYSSCLEYKKLLVEVLKPAKVDSK